MHSHRTTQMAFVLGGLLGQDVTFEGLTALDGATGTNAETLFRAALGLHFGHFNAPFCRAREAFADPSTNLQAPSHFFAATKVDAAGYETHAMPGCIRMHPETLLARHSGGRGPFCHRLCGGLALAGRDHHDHLAPFELRELLDQDRVAQIVADAVEQGQTDFLVGDFPTAETQRDLALVAFREEAADVAQLDVVVAIVRARTEFDFLDFDDRLLGLGLGRALLLLVLELSIVHKAAHGRVGRSGNLHQVHIQLARHAEGFHEADHPERLVLRPGEANLGSHDFTVQAVLALLALATVTKFSSDGCIPSINKPRKMWRYAAARRDLCGVPGNASDLVGDVLPDQGNEGLQRHHTQITVTPCPHGNGTSRLLLVAHDEDIGQLLQRMLSYFIRNLLVAQIQLYPKALIRQRFLELCGNFATVIVLRAGNVEHRHLHRGQPDGQRACVLLDQNSDETLQAADDGAVQHDGTVALTIFPHIFRTQALRHGRIHLDGAALPVAADRVAQRVLELRAVERAVAHRDLVVAARGLQALDEGILGFVPAFFRADALFGARRHLVDDVGEAEILVHLLQQRREVDALLLDLVFGAEDVAVVLREGAHAHDAVQAARGLVAVALAKLTVAQRQVAVALNALVEDQDVAGAVHRLEGVVVLLALRREHVLAVLVPVARLLPEVLVEDLRALDLLVAVVTVHLAHVLLHALPDRPALRVPENRAGGMLVDVEQVEFAAEAAVVALFGLLDALDVRLQVLLVGPGGAVDALQLLVLGIAAPIGAGNARQLEHLQESRVRHVRAAAHVHVFLVVVQAHGLLVGHVLHEAQLVFLAALAEDLDHLVTGRHLLDHVVVLRDELLHAMLDRREVFGREGALVGDVVIEAFLDHRADHHLRRRVELLDGMAHQVGAGVANDLHAFLVPRGDDLQARVVVDHVAGVHQAAIDLACHGHLGESRPDGLGHVGHRDGAGVFALGVVGERDPDHVLEPWVRRGGCARKAKAKKNAERCPRFFGGAGNSE